MLTTQESTLAKWFKNDEKVVYESKSFLSDVSLFTCEKYPYFLFNKTYFYAFNMKDTHINNLGININKNRASMNMKLLFELNPIEKLESVSIINKEDLKIYVSLVDMLKKYVKHNLINVDVNKEDIRLIDDYPLYIHDENNGIYTNAKLLYNLMVINNIDNITLLIDFKHRRPIQIVELYKTDYGYMDIKNVYGMFVRLNIDNTSIHGVCDKIINFIGRDGFIAYNILDIK